MYFKYKYQRGCLGTSNFTVGSWINCICHFNYVSQRKCNFVGMTHKIKQVKYIFYCYFNFPPLLDLPTVEELMKPIRIDSCGISGLDVQLVRYEFFEMDCASSFSCLFIVLSLETSRIVCSTQSFLVNG